MLLVGPLVVDDVVGLLRHFGLDGLHASGISDLSLDSVDRSVAADLGGNSSQPQFPRLLPPAPETTHNDDSTSTSEDQGDQGDQEDPAADVAVHIANDAVVPAEQRGRQLYAYWRSRAKAAEKRETRTLLQKADLQRELDILRAREARHTYHLQSKRRRLDATRVVLSIPGAYRLALKRNLGHASAAATADMLEVGVGTHAVLRAERLLHASLLAIVFEFYQRLRGKVRALQTQTLALEDTEGTVPLTSAGEIDEAEVFEALFQYRKFTWEIHCFRGDATNSSAHQSQKRYSSDVYTAACTDANNDEIEDQLFYPRLVYVPDPCDGPACKQMWEGIFEEAHIESWKDIAAKPNAQDRPDRHQPCHITVYIGCTDAGSDEASASRLVAAEIASCPTAVVCWTFCFMHRIQLIVLRQMARNTGYFATLAKLSNCWRATNNARRQQQTENQEATTKT